MNRQLAFSSDPHSFLCRCRCGPALMVVVWLVSVALLTLPAQAQRAGTKPSTRRSGTDAAMAVYADAANYQTGGAFDPAIQEWTKFLTRYPKHANAPQAAHYLGVCHMQKEKPNYASAIKAFQTALRAPKYDLRQESLANLGWCFYASAGNGEDRDPKRLRASLQVFDTLRKENPKSEFLDRAYFYSGEAAYGLGEPVKAIEYYDRLLSMPDAKTSPLRCDALYARGVAQEEAKKFNAAVGSYRQLLASCKRAELVSDVQLRMGDLMIMQKEFDKAIESFESAFGSSDSPEDQSYALYRHAFALVQAGRAKEAATKYEQLVKKFPASPYAGSAMLASAQSSYRAGDLEGAAARFGQVLKQDNREAATEAAHWLARIEITEGDADNAVKVVREQISKGLEGPFAMDLRLDLAEALSMRPDGVEESLEIFKKAYRESPQSPLAPRALYNAAFSALQLNQPKEAISLAAEFIKKFPQDTLLPDVRFVAAESQLMSNDATKAADTYRTLLASTAKDNPQRPLWLLRAGSAYNAAGKYDKTIDTLTAERGLFQQPSQKAEAYLLIGQAQLRDGKPEAAAKSLATSRSADPKWSRGQEARLLEGQSQLRAGNTTVAAATWNDLVEQSPDSPMADQARYQLAQLASSNGKFERAIGFYEDILESGKQAKLIPYAQYGKGWALMQIDQFESALGSLEPVLALDNHPLRPDALLARGISLRNQKQYDQAQRDLLDYLKTSPTGTDLGHALYELALIDQTEKKPGEAAKKLERLVKEVPDYESMDKVLYELGWSLQESGNDSGAVNYFTELISRHPDTPLVADAAYFIGQQHYVAKKWALAASQFEIAAKSAKSAGLSEKAHYRLGWSEFKDQNFEASERAFAAQANKHANGPLAFDALMMIGECRFKTENYKQALEAFANAREQIRRDNDTAKTVRDPAERRVRELVLLHGGQCAGQMDRWGEAIEWYDELRDRFPSTGYLPQVFYETGFAYQQAGDNANALKFYEEVADNYRNELAARARFMMGEIYFAEKKFDDAIPTFQRVMFGFGAENAPEKIKNWQAKSGFEAGRCSELLIDTAKTETAQARAQKIATDFYRYVTEKHPNHELAAKSRDRIEAIRK